MIFRFASKLAGIHFRIKAVEAHLLISNQLLLFQCLHHNINNVTLFSFRSFIPIVLSVWVSLQGPWQVLVCVCLQCLLFRKVGKCQNQPLHSCTGNKEQLLFFWISSSGYSLCRPTSTQSEIRHQICLTEFGVSHA